MELPPVILAVPGAFAGLMSFVLISRWLRLALAACGIEPTPGLTKNSPHRSRRAAAILAIIHPIPWLVIAGIFVGIPHVLASSARSEWIWFLVGLIVAPTLMTAFLYSAFARAKKLRAARSTNSV